MTFTLCGLGPHPEAGQKCKLKITLEIILQNLWERFAV